MSAFGGLHGVEDFVVGGIQLAHADVVADGAIEEENVLPDEADLRAEAGDGGFAEVDAIEKNGAFRRIVEAEDELKKSGFATAAGAYDDDELAMLDFEREAVQDRMGRLRGVVFGGWIRKADVMEDDVLRERLEGFGA